MRAIIHGTSMDNLISLYQQRLNLHNATFSRIDHDDTMVAVVYKVTLPEPVGTQLIRLRQNIPRLRRNETTAFEPLRFILKICTRAQDYFREVYFLKHFADMLPVTRIIQVVQPETGMYGAVLMECLPGALLEKKDLTDALAYEIGSLLARIHLNRVSGYGDLTQPDELVQDPRVYFALKFEESFAECSNHLPKALLEKCYRYYETHLNLLDSVDGPCMIHRDFRAGNIIVHNGKLQGIIDWASGRAGFAQEDFIPMEHAGWPTNATSKKSFLAGYASIRLVPDYSAMIPILRMGRAFATIGCTVKYETWESLNARAYQFNRHFLETFF